MHEEFDRWASRSTLDRRQLLHVGLRAGAALGISGLGGITLVGCGGDGEGGAVTTLERGVADWVPSTQPRDPRKYLWEPLAPGKRAPRTGKEVRLIGIGSYIVKPWLDEFERRTGHRVRGKVSSLTAMVTEWLGGGARNYDGMDTSANRNPLLWDAGVTQSIPVEEIVPWTFARELFTTPNAPGHDPVNNWPLQEIYVDPTSRKEFRIIPQYFNCDSIAYRYDLIKEDIDTWGALVDPAFKGKVAILNDSLLTPGWCAGYLKSNRIVDIKRSDNLTRDELDAVIDFLIERKKNGQFRTIWSEFGQMVDLMASGEVLVSDTWNPVVTVVAQQGIAAKYAFPKEGFTAWFQGLAIQKDSPDLDAVLDFANFGLEGWLGAQVAYEGYYSPTTTSDAYLQQAKTMDPQKQMNDYEWWYLGGASEDPKEGWPIQGRDTGSYDRRWNNIMHWINWPDEPDYYARRWNDFLAA